MVKIEILIQEGKLSKINELEKDRYINFFDSSYNDNLNHSEFVLQAFPRWSIISGYYAMHDISKSFLAKQFGLKVEMKVHATTIKALKELLKDKEAVKLMNKAYKEFKFLANDLADAKKERVKTQYYTGTDYMKTEYQQRATLFLANVVKPFVEKMRLLL